MSPPEGINLLKVSINYLRKIKLRNNKSSWQIRLRRCYGTGIDVSAIVEDSNCFIIVDFPVDRFEMEMSSKDEEGVENKGNSESNL